jgi:hypothetical protein
MRDAFQQKKDREATQQWYEKAWLAMDLFGIKQLPQKVIKWVVIREKLLTESLLDIGDFIIDIIVPEESELMPVFFFMSFTALSYWLMYQELGFNWWTHLYLILGIIVILAIAFAPNLKESLELIVTILLGIILFTGIVFILNFVTKLNAFIALLVLLFSVPILSFFTQLLVAALNRITGYVFNYNYEHYTEEARIFGFATSISFFITMLALYIGLIVSPYSVFPNSPQLLLFNVLFDGLTLLFTMALLKWSIKEKPGIRIPIAIIGDILIAALFACCSLYFGLLKSEFSLTFMETVNILIARSPAGNTWDLGPYFWAMHTTFIPTLLYLFFILLTLIGKYFTLPFMKLIKGASGAEKPHYATATTFGFIGAVFAAAAKFMEWCYL